MSILWSLFGFFVLTLLPQQCNSYTNVAKSLSHFLRLIPTPGGDHSGSLDDSYKLSLLPVAESETRGRMLLDGGDWLMAFCFQCQSADEVMTKANYLEFFQTVVPSAFAEDFPFNDSIRSYFGWLVYRRAVPIASYAMKDRFMIRFDSVLYQADIVSEIFIIISFSKLLSIEN